MYSTSYIHVRVCTVHFSVYVQHNLKTKYPRSSTRIVFRSCYCNSFVVFCSEQGASEWKANHGSLHYIFEAVLPFLQVPADYHLNKCFYHEISYVTHELLFSRQVFFKTYYQPNETMPDEANDVDTLTRALVVSLHSPCLSSYLNMYVLNHAVLLFAIRTSRAGWAT